MALYSTLLTKSSQEGDGIWSRFSIMLAMHFSRFSAFVFVFSADTRQFPFSRDTLLVFICASASPRVVGPSTSWFAFGHGSSICETSSPRLSEAFPQERLRSKMTRRAQRRVVLSRVTDETASYLGLRVHKLNEKGDPNLDQGRRPRAGRSVPGGPASGALGDGRSNHRPYHRIRTQAEGCRDISRQLRQKFKPDAGLVRARDRALLIAGARRRGGTHSLYRRAMVRAP